MRIEKESVRVGISVVSGVAAVLEAEAFRISGSENNPLVQMYEQNGALSRVLVAAGVAIASYCILEEQAQKSNKE